MEVNRLNHDELSYQLIVRDLNTGSVDDMRKTLRGALKMEKTGLLLATEKHPFTFEEDLDSITKKVVEVNELIEKFIGDAKSSSYAKIITKINWAFDRLNRMKSDAADQSKAKSELRRKLVSILGAIQTKVEIETSSDTSSDEADTLNCTSSANHRTIHRVPIYKWDLKFSGEQNQSLSSFLERVEELSEARGVSKSQLFVSALDLFTGRALVWYRANKTKFHSWANLVEELRKEFLPLDYDDRLTDEIKRRTQGRDETIGTYVATMTSLFNRLTISMSETDRMKILKRNINPFYQSQLGLSEVKTVDELVELGRKLEAVRASVEAFIPPPSRRNAHLLEPDLAYVSCNGPNISVIDQTHRSALRCFKCQREGHVARFCRGSLRCFGCGRIGVIRARCPRCSNQGTDSGESNNYSRNNAGNESRAQQ